LGKQQLDKTPGKMKALATPGFVWRSHGTFLQFPGHTWLQQDSQIYVPILEHARDATVLRNATSWCSARTWRTRCTTRLPVALRGVTGLGLSRVLAAQQS
jgi:hypothetical protein